VIVTRDMAYIYPNFLFYYSDLRYLLTSLTYSVLNIHGSRPPCLFHLSSLYSQFAIRVISLILFVWKGCSALSPFVSIPICNLLSCRMYFQNFRNETGMRLIKNLIPLIIEDKRVLRNESNDILTRFSVESTVPSELKSLRHMHHSIRRFSTREAEEPSPQNEYFLIFCDER